MSVVTQYQNYQNDDDGFSGSLTGGRLIKGQIVKWNETSGWTDRDGLRPPEIMLTIGLSEALQCWRGKKPVETITAKPLPDLGTLNEAVPKSEWELDLNGKPRPPWVHQSIVYFLDPTSGGFYTYLNSTIGARIAIDSLREKVVTMRALRGARVVPLTRLSHRPMKTQFGMRHRPEFEVVGWRTLGGNGDGAIDGQAPQLTAPKPEVPATSEAAKTISSLGEVSMPSTAEDMKDEIPW